MEMMILMMGMHGSVYDYVRLLSLSYDVAFVLAFAWLGMVMVLDWPDVQQNGCQLVLRLTHRGDGLANMLSLGALLSGYDGLLQTSMRYSRRGWMVITYVRVCMQ
jgi:hypothetical protein